MAGLATLRLAGIARFARLARLFGLRLRAIAWGSGFLRLRRHGIAVLSVRVGGGSSHTNPTWALLAVADPDELRLARLARLVWLARLATLGLLRSSGGGRLRRGAIAWSSGFLRFHRYRVAVVPVRLDGWCRDAQPARVLLSVTHPGKLGFGLGLARLARFAWPARLARLATLGLRCGAIAWCAGFLRFRGYRVTVASVCIHGRRGDA